ncbi:FkbM family methyltransferase [Prochlorococcus marinus]|uniref:FkbM family methyltransferase n=1 Tax=Prochlorococcus marinus TaxID=1219 RepID=UPI001ADAAAC8|nr:FkbM family methyltransferase [Prochlorococcus marinus]MBO8219579.1 FkbM family methyltransferase [Prochlorococcus marinus CUG1416]MBW3051952.1 hypothetical protein [Prochlorococcus marinus str. MU1416]
MKQILKNILIRSSPKMLRFIYELIEIKRSSNLKLKKSIWGFSMFSPNDLMSKGTFEEIDTKFFRKIIKDYECFVNIGANIGYYCLHALSQNIETIAVEPNPFNCKLLIQNIEINGFSEKFSLYPVGAAKKNGIEKLYGNGTAASFVKGWANATVENYSYLPLLSIDQITSSIRNKKTLLWMDIEGYEFEALLGAKQFLAENPKPNLVIEITTNQHQPKGSYWNEKFLKTFELLWSLGYDAYFVNNPNKKIDKSLIFNTHKNKIPLDSYNFLFIPKNNT